MKTQKVNLSVLEIDKILSEKYDLGFLLDQIKNKKYRGVYFLSIIDVLRFFPQFNEATKQIRKDLQIDPQFIQDELGILIGRSKFKNYLTGLKQIARAIDFPLNKESRVIINQIEDWKKTKFPSLPQKVANLRLKVFGKLPRAWQEPIEDYLLFEKISSTPLIYRRTIPKVNVKKDSKTSESYIEIKVYSDTDISILQKISWWKKVQKTLPAYTNPTEWGEYLLLSRFLQYILTEHLRLTQKQTLDWLESHNLTKPDHQHSSQEVNRFEKLFISANHK